MGDTSTNHWSCPCECNSASTPCEGKQVRTNFEGFLPEAGDKSHLENFGKDLQVCSCACGSKKRMDATVQRRLRSIENNTFMVDVGMIE